MTTTFSKLGLPKKILLALDELGYELPTPVQEASIPILMEGTDLSAQAQTGTGKTAAFALPILAQVDVKIKAPQALVIAPTRELAIQVAEALQSYAKHLDGFQVTPIYGGQDYSRQLKALKRGSHVIVGTPGRVMDHMRRESLSLDKLKVLVLDEADEMLRMGFVEDVEWILEQIDQDHQTALFSATMPKAIMKIAKCYLKNPEKVNITPKKSTVDTISQFYMRLTSKQKIEALTRYFEVEDISAAIIFVRTKNISMELAEKLQARGYAAAALNGDMNQSAREKVIGRIKKGSLDIVVATDVAARGIDVERISHVINYDIPYDVESYIHRIGRTGRAGRSGKSLLFVSPREQRLLRDIEKHIDKNIKKIEPPSIHEMSLRRDAQLVGDVLQAMVSHDGLEDCYDVLDELVQRSESRVEDVAAALIYLTKQNNPLPRHEIIEEEEEKPSRRRGSRNGGDKRRPRSNGKSSDRARGRKKPEGSRKRSGDSKKKSEGSRRSSGDSKGRSEGSRKGSGDSRKRSSDSKKRSSDPKRKSSRKAPSLQKAKAKKPSKKKSDSKKSRSR